MKARNQNAAAVMFMDTDLHLSQDFRAGSQKSNRKRRRLERD